MQNESEPKRNKGGRPKGSLNKSTAEVRKLAQKHSKRAINTLVNLMEKAESEQARVAAAKEILDRAHGKPKQAVEHSGEDGGPIQSKLLIEFV